MADIDREITVIAKTHPAAQRLQQLRGVGPLIADAVREASHIVESLDG